MRAPRRAPLAPAPSAADLRLLRAAARRTAAQAAALVALVALAVVTLTGWLMLREQRRQVDELLTRTAAVTDDVGDPPPGTWVVLVRGGARSETPGMPAGLSAALAGLRRDLPAPGRDALTDVDLAGAYRVVTRSATGSGGGVVPGVTLVQLAAAESRWDGQRERIVGAAALAAAAGLVLAAGAGLVLGRRAVRPLGAALALQRHFVADASHELRTPLALLSTRAQVLTRGLERRLDPDGEPAVRVGDHALLDDAHGVIADVHRLGAVLDDLLLAATPGHDGAGTGVDLTALAADVVASARDHAGTVGVDLRGPAGDAPAVPALCAPAAARRALLALVDNAVEHTPAGGAVSVSAARRHDRAVVAVRDTGPGIDPAAAAHLVRRFASGGQRAGRRHYGLGLALAAEVAGRHGGELRLAPGGPGATFELVLPAAARGRPS